MIECPHMQELQSIENLIKNTGAKTPQEPGAEDQLQEKMQEIGLKEKERDTQRHASKTGIPYVDLKGFAVAPEALVLLPREQSRELKAVVFLHVGSEVRLGAIDPAEEEIKEVAYQLGERHSANVIIYQISEESYRIADKLYDALPKIKKIVKGVEITAEELKKYRKQINSFADVQKMMADTNVTDVMSVLTAAALELDSSDIHIEAEERGIIVRFRVDGELQEIAELDKELWKQMVGRIKLISGLKINIIDRPQDGRMTIYIDEGKTEVRVSTIPTTWGESIVMRLLKPSAINVDFSALGLREPVYKRLNAEVMKPHGMVISTGPTGSGKTTTLYAALQKLNKPGVKILTLEDPVEYKLAGINQSQIDPSKHYSFVDGLRSILRQDPDIIMVGEIRDLETAETSINAALTGHLVLSTIHTNDAAGAIPRFISMGVKPFLLAPALNAVIAQRLVRKVCEKCKTADELSPEALERVQKILSAIPEKSGETVPDLNTVTFQKGAGCDICNNTGFKGRIGIFEVLIMNEDVETATREGSVSEFQMREIAGKQGMVTMVQDGLLKAVEGVTSVNEVFKVAAE